MASAQSIAVDVHFGFARWSEYYHPNQATDEHELFEDYGIGARLTWRPSPVFGIDGDTTWYPQGPGDQKLPGHRFEVLLGATVGPRMDRFRPFAKASLGFVKLAQHPDAVLCDQPVPPYLTCLLEAGRTLPAYDIGGGFEFAPSGQQFIRVDASTRILKYPGPAYARDGQLKVASFWGAGLRLAAGYGFQF